MFKGYAKIVDDQYQTFDFDSWSELSVQRHQEKISLTDRLIRVPRVIILAFYDKLPVKSVRLNRQNIFLRDKNQCQYCRKKFKRTQLNIDHVIPISQGGRTTWENVVCSCLPCNTSKGGRTPEQAKMKLLRRPVKPPHSIFMSIAPKTKLLNYWRIYMNSVDYAYWCLELRD